MIQRHRYWATIILWIVFIFLMLLTWDRMMAIPADFAGLWPLNTGAWPPAAQDAAELEQIIAAAREAGPQILDQVQETIRDQLALRVPLTLVLSAMYVFAATLATFFIWRNAGLEAYLAREAVQAEKVKRRSRIEQFMEDLDPDELVQLRARLGDNEAKASRFG